MSESARELFLYVGPYTAREAKGIYLYRFDTASGALRACGLAAEMPNPTFLALDPPARRLYAVSEMRDDGKRSDGSVSAFAIDGESGALTFLNRRPSGGVGPCHVAVDHAGRCVLVANYASGSIAAFPIVDDGRLGQASAAIQHHGSSVNSERQEGPHAHSVTLSPDNRFVLAADLGLDRIVVYQLDAATGRLAPNDPPDVAVTLGAGPRHLAFHPRRPFVYAINELGNTVTAFAWDALRGALRALQTLPTVPADFHGEDAAADVHVHPSGRFLYGSNRGHDSIAVFRIDEETGLLSPIQHEPTQGACPRNFAIDPTGTWLLAANQEGDSIVVFRIDPTSGRLSPAGHHVAVSMPVCLRFLSRPRSRGQ